MNAKTKLEVVPSAAEVLREAIARRDTIDQEIEAIRARAKPFAAIEAEASAAEAALQAILQKDAAAMQEWVHAGAAGKAPELDHKAREAATRKLSEAHAKLSATRVAKAQIDVHERAAHGRRQEAQEAVRAAEVEVLGQELIQSAHAMKEAAKAYLAAEQHYFNTRVRLFDLEPDKTIKATAFADQAASIGAPMSLQQEREFLQDVLGKSNERNTALRQGKEPADAPQVTA